MSSTRIILVLLGFVLFAGCASKLKRVAIEFEKYPFPHHMAELPDETPKEEMAFLFDMDLGSRFMWRNRIHAMSTSAQVRTVGWAYEFTWLACPTLELILWAHHSQHLLDRAQPAGRHFSVQDGVGFRWIIFED